jgi:hypothetical protein
LKIQCFFFYSLDGLGCSEPCSIVDQFCMAILYGRARCLTAFSVVPGPAPAGGASVGLIMVDRRGDSTTMAASRSSAVSGLDDPPTESRVNGHGRVLASAARTVMHRSTHQGAAHVAQIRFIVYITRMIGTLACVVLLYSARRRHSRELIRI